MAESLDLGKKLGPLPLGGWLIGGAVVGLGIGYFRRKRDASNEPLLEAPLGVGRGGVGAFSNTSGGESTPNVPATNQTWAIKVQNWLVGQGWPGTLASAAVSKYLNGQTMTAQEEAAVNSAVLIHGVPPEGISGPPGSAPKPVTNLAAVRVPNPNENEMLVTWWPSPGAMSYLVTQDSGGRDTEVTVVASQVRWFTAANVNVTYTVIARNDYGDSEPRSVTVYSGAVPIGRGGPKQPDNTQNVRRHVVIPGETLEIIAVKWGRSASDWSTIYQRNVSVIEEAARNNGRQSSTGPNGRPGFYLYAGTVLEIP